MAGRRLAAQRRGFYLGSLRGTHGRLHAALDGSAELAREPVKAMHLEAWREVWAKGPLHVAVGDEDERACYLRHKKQAAVEEDRRVRYAPFEKTQSDLQRAYRAECREAGDLWARTMEQIHDVDDSWEGRARLDWARMSDDTVARLALWQLFGGLPNTPSPPTAPPLEALHAQLAAHAERSGALPFAQQRSTELWVEAAYFAAANGKRGELEGLSEEVAVYAKDVFEKQKANGDTALVASPFRQPLTGFFVNAPPQAVVAKLPCAQLADGASVLNDLAAQGKLLRWYQGEFLPAAAASKAKYLAEQRKELTLQDKWIHRAGLDDDARRAAERQLRAHTEALEQIQRDQVPWAKVLARKGKPLAAEQSHLLRSLPAEPAPASPYVTEGRGEGAAVRASFQRVLGDLLGNATHRKCLAVGTDEQADELRAALYEAAWLAAKEEAHDVYSQQRKDVNHLLQRARRRVEAAVQEVLRSPEHAAVFERERSVPVMRDLLYAPDKYSASLRTATVVTSHDPFTTGGFEDQAPGVRV